MCRNIKTLYNFDPPATDQEINAASVQFVRKLTGYNKPSAVNDAAFNQAVEEVTAVTKKLFSSLSTHSHPHDREVEATRAKLRSEKRFPKSKI